MVMRFVLVYYQNQLTLSHKSKFEPDNTFPPF